MTNYFWIYRFEQELGMGMGMGMEMGMGMGMGIKFLEILTTHEWLTTFEFIGLNRSWEWE